MSKNVTFIIIAILMILIGGGLTGYFLIGKKTPQNINQNTSSGNLINQDAVKGDLTYEDASGFSFKYPNSIKVVDVTPDENIYYSSLKLTKGEEFLLVTMKDTSLKSVEDWTASKEAPVGLELPKTVNLGGISAKQFVSQSKIITVAIDEGVLYLIEGLNDKGYWEQTQDVIISSFSFAGAKSTGTSTSGGGNAIYEEEEVVE